MRTAVRIWRIDLRRAADESILSAEEQARAVRLVIPDAKRRFAAAHGGLREILARLTGTPAGALTFGAGQYGKPYLTGIPDAPHFNLSHSADVALVAVADTPVGVDIERLRWLPNLDQMAEIALTTDEQTALAQVEEPDRVAVFCRTWTRKEAVMKADGAGFRLAHSFSLPVPPTLEAASSPFAATVQIGAARYTVTDVPAGNGYLAAVAVEGDAVNVTLHNLD